MFANGLARCFVLLGLTCASVFGQAGLGSITGSVIDKTSAAIAGAKITLVQLSTQTTRDIATNEQGIFNLPSIVPGTYTLTIASPGFRDKKLENLVINGFQELSLGTIELELGSGPATEITVTAEQQLVKDSGARADTIQSEQVEDMPNNGRNWATLLKIIPGSTAISDQGLNGREYGYYGYQDFSVNGKAYQQTQVNLDGGSIVDHGSDGKVTVSPSLESIQEISILTNNFTAEYGNRGGISINIVTKSGTNKYHGVAFENLRNEALNANSWANNYTGLPRAMYRYNYFGANLGGPLRKNKLFFFYNFEKFRQNVPGTIVQARVPTDLERTGDFSQTFNSNGSRPTIYQPGTQYSGTPLTFPNNVIPQSLINPLGKAILAIYPKPNNPSDPNNNYTLVYQALYPRLSQVGKVDWNINDTTRAYIRYSNDSGTNQDKGIYNSSANLPFNMMNQYRPDRAVAVNVTHVFSSSVVLETLLGWSYDYVEVTPAFPDQVDASKLGLSGLPTVFKSTSSILPGINPGGVYPTFTFNRLPAFADANEYQTSGALTWTKGRHTVKIGGQFMHNTKQEITAANDKGTFDFSASHSAFDTNYGPANVLVGAVNEFTQVSSISHKDSYFNDFQLYAQDNWKVNRSLTLNYGVRFYHMPAERDSNPAEFKDAVFLPNLYDPRQAVRYYIPDPKNSKNVIDPLYPNAPLSSNVASLLLYTIVPGSGNPLNGVYALGSDTAGPAGLLSPKSLLLAPRGGFAYSPRRDPKLVIRGGFGWAYNRNLISDAITAFNNGLTQNVDYLQTSLSTLVGGSSISRVSASSFAARDASSRKTPTVYDYSLSMQHELPFKMVLDLSYVGNLQRHQAINFNLNAIQPGAAFQSQYVDSTNAGYNFYGPITASNPNPLPGSNSMNALVMRPYAGMNTLTATANVGNNRYDSFQAHLNKRFGSGLMFQMAFTKGRLISGQDSPGLYSYNWKQYTGNLANNNRTYTLATNYIYSLPAFSKKIGFSNVVTRGVMDGWQFAHLLSFFGGMPYTPTISNVIESNTGTSVSLPLVFLGTPDLSPRPIVTGNLSSKNPVLHFDANGLSVPGIFPSDIGAAPRNYLTAPGTFANDMTLAKQFRIAEGKTVELRAAGYNVFNMVRRTNLNTGIQFKANGANFSNGFYVYNLPDQLVARSSSSLTPVQLYNQYRGGVGYDNITSVQPMRIIEFGLKVRF